MGNSEVKLPKLLIAEDDPENQKFLQIFLERYFSVDICDSSESFYEFISCEKYDVILMDISIRGQKNGLELTKELKENPEYSKIPIVCYTAHAFNTDRINALDAGCDLYLSKPSDIRILLNSLMGFVKETKTQYLHEQGINLSFNPPSGSASADLPEQSGSFVTAKGDDKIGYNSLPPRLPKQSDGQVEAE